jgi:carbonic anhydrase/acetyltransferase-like protein (isoleucine patch superfamily)
MIIKFKNKIPTIGKKVFIAKSADVIGDLDIQENSSIWFNCVIRADVNKIRIGKNTNIQDLTMIHVDSPRADSPDGYPTLIGDDVTIGHNCCIHGCIIEDSVLVGMGTTILNGVVISKESIIGANSLVTTNKKFPPRSLIMGSPAKLIRQLTQKEIDFLYQSAKYYSNLKNDYF